LVATVEQGAFLGPLACSLLLTSDVGFRKSSRKAIGLLSLEIASIMLLLGAQVIAEYERLQDGDTAAPEELRTDVAHAKVR